VLPSDFEDPSQARCEGAAPDLSSHADRSLGDAHSGRFGQAIGRLAPGISLEGAQAELTTIAKRLEEEYPGENAGLGRPGGTTLGRDPRRCRTALLVLLGAVGVVLLITCANVANSLLVRFLAHPGYRGTDVAGSAQEGHRLVASGREHHPPCRCLGVLLAQWAIRVLVASGSLDIPWIEQVGTDARVLLFGLVLSLSTGLIFGLLLALEVARPNLQQTLREGGRSYSPAPTACAP